MTAPKVASNTKNVGVVIIGQGAGRIKAHGVSAECGFVENEHGVSLRLEVGTARWLASFPMLP
jgi:hypothetical protein